jgi:hypothetical protein
MKKPALILIALMLGAMWVLFHSEYDFTTYVVQGCAQPVTVVQYTKPLFGGRGVAIVLGNYTTSEIPQQDCLNFARESGFDTLAFQAIITCENGTVVVYHENTPLSSHSVPGMKAQKVDYEAYQKLRNMESMEASGRTVITLY